MGGSHCPNFWGVTSDQVFLNPGTSDRNKFFRQISGLEIWGGGIGPKSINWLDLGLHLATASDQRCSVAASSCSPLRSMTAASTPSEADTAATSVTPAAWHVPELGFQEARHLESVRDHVQAYKELVLQKFGGPAQHLRAVLCSTEQQTNFADWLCLTFPLLADTKYHLEKSMPAVLAADLGAARPLVVHVCQLGFAKEASVKPNPSSHSASLIVEHFLTQGFLSGEEPLQVKLLDTSSPYCPWSSSEGVRDPMGAFSLGYSKGMLRATTLLSLLLLWYEDGSADKFLASFEKLRTTISKIYVHAVAYPSLAEEIFANFRMSLRGAIRKPPNMLTWITVLQNLKGHGYEDSGTVISRYNASVGPSSQLVGAKAVAVANLMSQFPQDLLDLLAQHVSSCSWEHGGLSDDVLSSKKILPNHQFRAPHKQWKKWTAASVESSKLTMRRLICDFEKQKGKRRKADRAQVDQLAEMACLLVNLTNALKEQFPFKMEDVDKEIYNKWVDACPGLELELHEAQAEKRAGLSPLDVKFLR